jgi:hypothetical protein
LRRRSPEYSEHVFAHSRVFPEGSWVHGRDGRYGIGRELVT